MFQDECLYLVHVQGTFSDSCEESVDCLVLELLHELGHLVVRELQLPVFQPAPEDFLALGSLLVFSLAESLAYLVPCLGGHHEIDPVR